jgi:hypothetical protein
MASASPFVNGAPNGGPSLALCGSECLITSDDDRFNLHMRDVVSRDVDTII